MIFKLKDESKMKGYLAGRISREVTQTEFEDLIRQFNGSAKYIYEDTDGKELESGISTECEIGEDWYEFWVLFSYSLFENEPMATVDFDYNYRSAYDTIADMLIDELEGEEENE